MGALSRCHDGLAALRIHPALTRMTRYSRAIHLEVYLYRQAKVFPNQSLILWPVRSRHPLHSVAVVCQGFNPVGHMQPAILFLRSKLVELVCKSWGRREDSIPPQKVSVIRISRAFIVVGGVIFWHFNPAADS